MDGWMDMNYLGFSCCVDGWMDGWMDGSMEGCSGWRKGERASFQMDGTLAAYVCVCRVSCVQYSRVRTVRWLVARHASTGARVVQAHLVYGL